MIRSSFHEFFRLHELRQPGTRFLIACSGGLDSTALAQLMKEAGSSFALAHVNFNLRGAESDRDEAFVRELGKRLDAQVHVASFATEEYASIRRMSIQEAARNLRYEWFERVRREQGFDWLLTAHHVDDNIETMLHHLLRGTGLKGLTGMPAMDRERRIARPLLNHTRAELLELAEKNGWTWVEDSSNAASDYTRNGIRNEILPLIEQRFPNVRTTLLDTIHRLQGTQVLYRELLDGLKKKIGRQVGDEWRVPVKLLERYRGTALFYELLQDHDFTEKQVPELEKLLQAPSGRYLENEHRQIIRHRNWLLFVAKTPSAETIIIREPDVRVEFPGGHLNFQRVKAKNYRLDRSQKVAQLDERALEFPLLLRRWKSGDYFYPFGMRKKKKLARFFIDQKFSKKQKESVWVLESAGRIAWIVGHRIDDRFRITESTRSLAVITIDDQVIA